MQTEFTFSSILVLCLESSLKTPVPFILNRHKCLNYPIDQLSGYLFSCSRQALSLSSSFLPSANQVVERLCFYTCLSFCPRGRGVSAPVHAGIYTLPGQTPPWADPPPHPADGHCCRRYASYWNAFLFFFVFNCES